MLKTNWPVTVGVPEMTPSVENDRPSGNEPEMIAKVTGAVAPCVLNDALNGDCAVATGNHAGHTVIDPQFTFSVNVRVPIHPLLSVAVTVKSKEPVTVGVPEITPAAESDRPSGNEPAARAKVTGVVAPIAESAELYATCAKAAGRDAGESVIVPQFTLRVNA